MEQAIAFLRGGVSHHRPCCTTTGCDEETNAIVAVVGPAKSSTTIAVQNLLQVFRIPQIGTVELQCISSSQNSFENRMFQRKTIFDKSA